MVDRYSPVQIMDKTENGYYVPYEDYERLEQSQGPKYWIEVEYKSPGDTVAVDDLGKVLHASSYCESLTNGADLSSLSGHLTKVLPKCPVCCIDKED